MPRKSAKTPSFEEGLAKLESMADRMEQGELPLDELLKLYEEGMKLSAELTKKLDEAEGRMQEIALGKDGQTIKTETDVVQQQSLLDEIND